MNGGPVDPLMTFQLEQMDELKALVLERSRLKLAAGLAFEEYERINERVEMYLKGMAQEAYNG